MTSHRKVWRCRDPTFIHHFNLASHLATSEYNASYQILKKYYCILYLHVSLANGMHSELLGFWALTFSGILNKLRGLSPRPNYTDRGPPLADEVSANIFGWRDVAWSARRNPTAVFSDFKTGAATFFFWSSSSIVLTRLSGPRSRPTTQEIW
jgi:hypothetical protein